MSGSNSNRNKSLIAGTLGAAAAAALLGGAGLFIYRQLEKKRNRGLARSHQSGSQSSLCSSSVSNDSFFTAFDDDNIDVLENEKFEDCYSDLDLSHLEINDSEPNLIELVDTLMKGNEKDMLEALTILEKEKHLMSFNYQLLWRLAKAHQLQASAYGAQGNLEKKKHHVYEGLKYAKKALSLTNNCAEVHKWFAILIGMQTEFVSINEKIQNGYMFQKHILIAIKMKPEDYSLHHLLGRFKFELAKTSWLEKKLAQSFFNEFPDFTYEDAISDFLKAEKLNDKPWKENKLLLAKCYMAEKKYSLAVKWLKSAQKIPPNTKEDSANDQEVNLLIDECYRYI